MLTSSTLAPVNLVFTGALLLPRRYRVNALTPLSYARTTPVIPEKVDDMVRAPSDARTEHQLRSLGTGLRHFGPTVPRGGFPFRQFLTCSPRVSCASLTSTQVLSINARPLLHARPQHRFRHFASKNTRIRVESDTSQKRSVGIDMARSNYDSQRGLGGRKL